MATSKLKANQVAAAIEDFKRSELIEAKPAI
jgi:hypothetical protein